MASKSKKKLKPSRSKSKEIYEAILTAAQSSFQNVGLKSTTTNKIAKDAGVSVGSLYQYFSNKEGILNSLIDRLLEGSREAFRETLKQYSGLSLEDAIPKMVDLAIERFTSRKGFYKIYFQCIHLLGLAEFVFKRRRMIAADMAEILIAHFEMKMPAKELENRLFLIVNSYMGLMEEYCVSETPSLTLSEIKAEMVRLTKSALLEKASSSLASN